MAKYQSYVDSGYSPQPAVSEVINDIRRQFPIWPTTVSTCQTDGCSVLAKGGYCASCLAIDLAKVTGSNDVWDFLIQTSNASKAAAKIMEAAAKDAPRNAGE